MYNTQEFNQAPCMVIKQKLVGAQFLAVQFREVLNPPCELLKFKFSILILHFNNLQANLTFEKKTILIFT